MKEKLKVSLYICIFILFCMNCIVIFKSALFPDDKLELFGYKPYIAVNNANTTDVSKGDFIIVKEKKNTEYSKDDVVLLKKENRTYKVINIENDDLYLENDYNSNLKTSKSLIEGKVVFSIRNIGAFLYLLQNPITICLIVCIIILLAIVRYRLALRKIQ